MSSAQVLLKPGEEKNKTYNNVAIVSPVNISEIQASSPIIPEEISCLKDKVIEKIKSKNTKDMFVACKYVEDEYKLQKIYTRRAASSVSNNFMKSVNTEKMKNHISDGNFYWFNKSSYDELVKLNNPKHPDWGKPDILPVDSSFNRFIKRKALEEPTSEITNIKKPKYIPFSTSYIGCKYIDGDYISRVWFGENICKKVYPRFMDSVNSQRTSNHIEVDGYYWFERTTYGYLRKFDKSNKKWGKPGSIPCLVG